MLKAVFLDRDGVLNKTKVINGKPFAPKKMKDFIFLPKVVDSVRDLKKAGFVLIVVTNQPDVGNGLVEKNIINLMNKKLIESLEIDGVKVCFHSQDDNCACRKPKPGMIFEAASEFNLDLKNSYMVGDRKSDVEAGKTAGCNTVFIDCGYCESEKSYRADYIVNSLPEAVLKIISD